jgi:cytochrome c oxidase cbb3-type subunit 3
MSDFATLFWDYYIAVLTVVSVVGCAVFLKLQSTYRVKMIDTPEGRRPDTTGHVWDGDITEYHHPMPRWWIVLFYVTIIFSAAYLYFYPGLGTAYKGSLDWTSTNEHNADVKAAAAVYGPLYDAYLSKDLKAVAADTRARQMGERLFQNNCATCHGVDARGARGFPNLADAEWLHGNSPEAIKTSVTEGRSGLMPPMAEAIGGGENVTDVANYVLSLSDSAHDTVRAARGKEKFAVCAACHGADGKGNPQLGAPDLSNRIWLYGGTVASISETITRGRNGQMPAHKTLLTPGEIHVVAAYVLSLGGGGQ